MPLLARTLASIGPGLLTHALAGPTCDATTCYAIVVVVVADFFYRHVVGSAR